MKQGKASRNVSESRYRDPMAKAMDVKGVSQIGRSLGDHISGKARVLTDVAQPLHSGRGYSAPHNASQSTRKGGTQGRH